MVLRGRERAQLWNMQATLGVNRSFAMITTLLVITLKHSQPVPFTVLQ